MRKTASLLLFVALALACSTAWAWGKPGHQVVGHLASAQLRPAARAEVGRLLAGEADPSLAGVAAWADELREGEMAGKGTAALHFVNFKGGQCQYVPARDCPQGNCVIAAINRNFLVLADTRRPDAERARALKFLIHFVADVHQPLHASSILDKGGNEFQTSYQGRGGNLHATWDRLLPARARLAPDAYAAVLAMQPALPDDPTRRSDRPAVDWALESCALVAAAGFYPQRHVLDDAYLDRQRPLAEQRLRLAGQRLADMLNYTLDPPVRR